MNDTVPANFFAPCKQAAQPYKKSIFKMRANELKKCIRLGVEVISFRRILV